MYPILWVQRVLSYNDVFLELDFRYIPPKVSSFTSLNEVEKFIHDKVRDPIACAIGPLYLLSLSHSVQVLGLFPEVWISIAALLQSGLVRVVGIGSRGDVILEPDPAISVFGKILSSIIPSELLKRLITLHYLKCRIKLCRPNYELHTVQILNRYLRTIAGEIKRSLSIRIPGEVLSSNVDLMTRVELLETVLRSYTQRFEHEIQELGRRVCETIFQLCSVRSVDDLDEGIRLAVASIYHYNTLLYRYRNVIPDFNRKDAKIFRIEYRAFFNTIGVKPSDLPTFLDVIHEFENFLRELLSGRIAEIDRSILFKLVYSHEFEFVKNIVDEIERFIESAKDIPSPIDKLMLLESARSKVDRALDIVRNLKMLASNCEEVKSELDYIEENLVALRHDLETSINKLHEVT